MVQAGYPGYFLGKKKYMWQAYILECADGTFYAGITTDIERRLKEHNGRKMGAKYTAARRPVKLAWIRGFENRSLASREEARIKKMTRAGKSELVKKK